MHKARKLAAGLSACVLTTAIAAAGAANASAADAGKLQRLPPPDAVANSERGTPEYRIIPQDVLDITVLQVPELSKAVTVDNNGAIALPFLGEVPVANKTPQQVSDELTRSLGDRFMKDPQVTVRVSEAQGRKVTVDGAVASPGAYVLSGPTSLLQVIALAKGPDPRLANERRVAVFRTVGGARKMAMFDLRAIRRGEVEDPTVYGGDIVVVDTSGTKTFLQNYQPGFGLMGLLFGRPW
ncbi:polysaccharide biosynthesis/export family protein [Phenylobacterium sp.]|uniref:polysaccharide biosynthesis/export family protein n=1 Tax=Phenylobacterium sp. TaxID=1871053 RepID=UPI002BC6A5E1|nr:polysaccharide biosynthesis/export family protein [Phenylobacterium sp.]HVI30550.1 polysaccharide biosynthesis/export family protein [Phenylobacterium sp.]